MPRAVLWLIQLSMARALEALVALGWLGLCCSLAIAYPLAP